MKEEDIYKWVDEMCELINEFSKCRIHPDSPIFKFKLSMIDHRNKYMKNYYQNWKFK